MLKFGESFSNPVTVKSGQGAQPIHKVADFNRNLLDTNTLIETIAQPIGVHKNHGIARKYGGGNAGVKYTDAFNYPDIRKPQGYALSKPGFEGKGNLAGGAYNAGGHDHDFKPATELLEAQGIVNREVEIDYTFGKSERNFPFEHAKHDIRTLLEDQALLYNQMRIKDLLAKGFTEEEVKVKIDKEREKAIEKAEKMPYSKQALMEAEIAKMLPDTEQQMFSKEIAAPGLVPAKRDTTAYARATDSLTGVQKAKKYQAMNRQLQIARATQVELPKEVHEKEHHYETVGRIGKQIQHEKQKLYHADEDIFREQNLMAKEHHEKTVKRTIGRPKKDVEPHHAPDVRKMIVKEEVDVMAQIFGHK